MKIETKHINKILEISYVILIIGFFLWLCIGGIWDHKIQHSHPYGYLATDAFQHQTRAQWIKDAGGYEFEAPYYSGNFKDITGFYPPIIHHTSILLSYSSGLEVYDTMYLLNFLFYSFGILIMYLIMRRYNKYIAILALPLALFVLKIKGGWVSLLWGHWPAVLGDFFLIAACWAISRFEIKKSYFLVGLFIAGTAMAHTSSTVFAGLFLIFFAIIKSLKGIDRKFLIKIALAVLIAVIIASGYLLIFQATWLKVQSFQFHIKTNFAGGGGFIALADFGWFMYLMAIGIILSLLLILKNRKVDKTFVPILSLFILIMGFTNYIGFERRAFNLRYYWPIFLSFFIGLALYFLLVKHMKNKKLIASIVIGIIISIIIFTMPPKWGNNPGLINQPMWETENWISQNTPEEAKILYWYGDFYDQSAHLGNTKRNFYLLDYNEFIQNFKENKITSNYSIRHVVEVGGGLPKRVSLFKFRLLKHEDPSLSGFKRGDVCDFNYFVFDKVSRYPELAQFNLRIAQKMWEHKAIEKVFENQLNVVFKNKNPGADCL